MLKVCLDPGHGGTDSGAVGNGIREKDINLKVALMTKDLLAKNGIEVKLTRTTDTTLSLSQRVSISNSYKPNCFVSIHCNAASSSSAQGLETFSSTVSTNDLATDIQNELLATKCYTKNRGVKDELYYVLKNTSARAALVELAFITNSQDSQLLKDKQKELSIGIAKGICKYLGVAYTDEVKPEKEIFYRVVAGSYSDEDNAKARIKELEAKGITGTFITTFVKE